MKIGPFENKPPVAPATERKVASSNTPNTPAAPAATSAAATAQASATVAISTTAAALSKAAGDGSFDTVKVDLLSRAINSGMFKPNPESIADKLIANAQELLSRATQGGRWIAP